MSLSFCLPSLPRLKKCLNEKLSHHVFSSINFPPTWKFKNPHHWPHVSTENSAYILLDLLSKKKQKMETENEENILYLPMQFFVGGFDWYIYTVYMTYKCWRLHLYVFSEWNMIACKMHKRLWTLQFKIQSSFILRRALALVSIFFKRGFPIANFIQTIFGMQTSRFEFQSVTYIEISQNDVKMSHKTSQPCSSHKQSKFSVINIFANKTEQINAHHK